MNTKTRSIPPFLRPGIPFFLALAPLAGVSNAQQGSYRLFGKGCARNTPIYGAQANWHCSQPKYLITSGARYAIITTNLQKKTIHGASFRMRAKQPVQAGLSLWLVDKALVPTKQVAQGTIKIGTSWGVYSGSFKTPYDMPGNRPHALVLNLPRGTYLPTCLGGTPVKGWYQAGGKWRNLDLDWIFREDCGIDTRLLELTQTAPPLIGHPLHFFTKNTTPLALVWVLFGASNKTFGGLPLPLPLKTLGAPGCSLLVSMDFLAFTRATNGGINRLTIKLPSSPSLVGLKFFNQSISLAPGANRLGLVFSNGGEGKIGKPCADGPKTKAGAILRFSFPPLPNFGMPSMSLAAPYSGLRNSRCCGINGPRGCHFEGSGSLTGSVPSFSIPPSALATIQAEVNTKVLDALKKAALGYTLTGSTGLSVQVGGIQVQSKLAVFVDGCTKVERYDSSGSQVLFPKGVTGSARITGTIQRLFGGKKSFTADLNVSGPSLGGSFVIKNNKAQLKGGVGTLRIQGKVALPLANKTVTIDFTISTGSRLLFTTPWSTLPKVPITCP